MKIRKLQLKNIGVFDKQEIVFQPCKAKDKAEIHIFTGQNGSGKSTILMALASSFNFYRTFDRLANYPKDIWGIDINSFSKRFHHINNPNDETGINSFAKIVFSSEVETVVFVDKQTKRIEGYDVKGNLSNYRLLNLSFHNEAKLEFAAFAFSGYRQIKSERVEAIKEPQ